MSGFLDGSPDSWTGVRIFGRPGFAWRRLKFREAPQLRAKARVRRPAMSRVVPARRMQREESIPATYFVLQNRLPALSLRSQLENNLGDVLLLLLQSMTELTRLVTQSGEETESLSRALETLSRRTFQLEAEIRKLHRRTLPN